MYTPVTIAIYTIAMYTIGMYSIDNMLPRDSAWSQNVFFSSEASLSAAV